MGLTHHSMGAGVLLDCGRPDMKKTQRDKLIALAGNPNVGKSTVFNSLTGLNQHTGNWPGKTVGSAYGKVRYNNQTYIFADIPGTYSLMANSPEEEIARDFLCFGAPDAVVIVADATCLERNLNLVLQTMELTPQVILCVNLMDEAKSRSIRIDLQRLAHCLGIPVVGTAARSGRGLNCLMDEVARLTAGDPGASPLRFTYPEEIEQAIKLIEPVVEKFKKGTVPARWIALSLLYADARFLHSIEQFLIADLSKNRELTDCVSRAADFLKQRGIEPDSLRDRVVSRIITLCEEIGQKAVAVEKTHSAERDRKIDRILTARSTGIPLMLALLFIIFWLTISGANYPSGLLADGLFWIEGILEKFLVLLSAPDWLIGVLAYGIYRTLAWVISVMLPPMAIFFPLFTLLEDLGYLPRIAFNLDNLFRKACAHGKQALTMCMGFGCNAAGVIGCRIIDTPRERLIAILTNSLVPCNGKFPTLIAIITMFFAGAQGGVLQSVTATVLLTFVILLGVAMTFLLSRLLSKTVLKGVPSSFNLELPPFRRPQLTRILLRSVLDRTLFVLARAAAVAAPAGLLIWLLANLRVSDSSLLAHCAGFLDPFARLMGLDGYILFAFILGFPANEIVVPILIMSYTSSGHLTELSSLSDLHALLIAQGWTWLTAVNMILFSLFHWPCGTSLLTIRKETRSTKWTLLSFALPTSVGILMCLIAASIARITGLVSVPLP